MLAMFFYVSEPVVDMRETPSNKAKVVSQASFAEEVAIEDFKEDWAYVKTLDEYLGWIKLEALVKRDSRYLTDLKISRLKSPLFGVDDVEYGPLLSLPYGSKLKSLEEVDSRWLKVELPDKRLAYLQKGEVELEPVLNFKEDLPDFSLKFLGLPYTWGGRSSFGYDCSGFVQMLYSQLRITLPRDASLQVEDKRLKTIALEALEPGDLIFWGKSAQKILHVGMYLGDQTFIHTSTRENKPWVRVSHLDDPEWCADPEAHYPYRTFKAYFTIITPPET